MDGRVCRVVYPEGVALLRSSVPGSAGRETRAATTDQAREAGSRVFPRRRGRRGRRSSLRKVLLASQSGRN